MVSYPPHGKEPAMKGHLLCRGHFFIYIEVFLEDGFYCMSIYTRSVKFSYNSKCYISKCD